MCLILVAWHSHPDYPLVVAANRDEFFARPTTPAEFWRDAPGLLAGRDLEAGGTWLGVAPSGRFAALTNYRDPAAQRPSAPSRGRLPVDFLSGGESAPTYLAGLVDQAGEFNGFNLLVGDGRSLWCFSNVEGRPHELAPGVYGLSNHLLDTAWPKVAAAKSALTAALDALPDDAPLFELLRNDAIHPDADLPDTGVGLEWERLLSAAFVRSPNYGTRCSTVLMLRGDGRAIFDERTWLPGGTAGGRVRFSFGLERAEAVRAAS